MKKLIAALAAVTLLAMFGVLLSRPQAVHTTYEEPSQPPLPVEEWLAALQRLRHDVRKHIGPATVADYERLLQRYGQLSADPTSWATDPKTERICKAIREVQRDVASKMPMIRQRLEAMKQERKAQRAAGKR